MTIDLNKYIEFVDNTTSKCSKDYDSFIGRLAELDTQKFHTERMLTAAVGMSAEAGEFTEVVKKMIFQGKKKIQNYNTNEKGSGAGKKVATFGWHLLSWHRFGKMETLETMNKDSKEYHQLYQEIISVGEFSTKDI